MFFCRKLCEEVWNATVDEVLKLGSSHLLRLFSEEECSRAIVVNPVKMKETEKHFRNIRVTTLDNVSSEFSNLSWGMN